MRGKGKPVAEALANIYVSELAKLTEGEMPPWENLSDQARAAHLGAMHSVVAALRLFSLEVVVDNRGYIVTRPIPTTKKATAPSPPKRLVQSDVTQARQMGFTGDMCIECGSMQMTRNGSCLKCMSCGATTGCS